MNSNEIIRLIKENAGLKLGYEKYKRKYSTINRILQRKLWLKIDGLRVQYSTLAFRLPHAKTQVERETIQATLRFISQERKELEDIYELCREVSK